MKILANHLWRFSRQEIFSFAELTGDTNPLHISSEYAHQHGHCDVTVHASLIISRVTALAGSNTLTKSCVCIEVSGEFRAPLYPDKDYDVGIAIRQISEPLALYGVECEISDNTRKNMVLLKLTFQDFVKRGAHG